MRDHPLVQLTLARMREFYREPEAIFWVFGFPIVLAFALGIAFRNRGPGELRVAVLHQPGDSGVAAALAHAPGLRVGVVDSAAARLELRTGRCSWSRVSTSCTATTRPAPKAGWRGCRWMTRCSGRAAAPIRCGSRTSA